MNLNLMALEIYNFYQTGRAFQLPQMEYLKKSHLSLDWMTL